MSEVTVQRHARYSRRLELGDFSLEANTEGVPEAGHFYLLRAGEVLLRSDDFRTAESAYHNLCRLHWEHKLVSDRPTERMASAWGLIGLEPAHRGAAAVIEQDGQLADQTRLARMRSRQRAVAARSQRLAGRPQR